MIIIPTNEKLLLRYRVASNVQHGLFSSFFTRELLGSVCLCRQESGTLAADVSQHTSRLRQFQQFQILKPQPVTELVDVGLRTLPTP